MKRITAGTWRLAALAVASTWVALMTAQAVPAGGQLYATDAAGGNLLTIDPESGLGSVVGSLGIGSVPALAVDPATGILYAGGGGGLPRLYTVNPLTAAATLVGDTGLGESAVGGMDFNQLAVLHASVNIVGGGGSGSDHLAIIDKKTGAATVSRSVRNVHEHRLHD